MHWKLNPQPISSVAYTLHEVKCIHIWYMYFIIDFAPTESG